MSDDATSSKIFIGGLNFNTSNGEFLITLVKKILNIIVTFTKSNLTHPHPFSLGYRGSQNIF